MFITFEGLDFCGKSTQVQLLEKYFVGNAQLLRRIQAMETALKENAKIVVPTGSDLVNVLGEMAGVLPFKNKGTRESPSETQEMVK